MAVHTLHFSGGGCLSSGKPGPAIRCVRVNRFLPQSQKIGSAWAVLAEIEIMDARECPLRPGEEFTLLKDGEQVGIFLVEEIQKDDFACWRITAYDRMRKLDKMISLPKADCSLWQLAERVCRECGVSLCLNNVGGDLPDTPLHPELLLEGNRRIEPRFPFGSSGTPTPTEFCTHTGRQVMKEIAKEMGCFARANNQGEIVFIRCNNLPSQSASLTALPEGEPRAR